MQSTSIMTKFATSLSSTNMKNDYDISRQQQDDLIKAYNKVAPTCFKQVDAYRKAVKEPAPRYYVTPKQAAQIISPMVRGDFSRFNKMSPNRKRMYYSLFLKVIELSEKRAFIGKSLIHIMEYAVLCPAPEFFINKEALAKTRGLLKCGYIDDSGKASVPYRVKAYERLKLKREKHKARMERLKARKQKQS